MDLTRVNVIPRGERFATALSDFEDRATSCILVDKTQALVDFLSHSRPLHCVLRPRRSGKTTMLTMFKTFFEAGAPEEVLERRSMFKDLNLKVFNTRFFESHFAKYTVLYINFSDLRAASNKEEFDELFTLQLNSEVRRHDRLRHFEGVIKPEDMELINDIAYLKKGNKVRLETAYYNLTRILYDSMGRKILVLVDEYDTPVSSARNQEVYTYAESFLRHLFGTLIRRNPLVFGALFVGILRCQRSSFLSSIPSMKIYPFSPDESLYSDACLFTEEETRALFNHVKSLHADLSFSFDELKEWYEGYVGANQRLYSPWTVCRALESLSLDTYWNDTGHGYFLVKHIFGAGRQFQQSLSKLLSGSQAEFTVRERLYPVSFGKLSPSDIFGILKFAGYLTEVRPKTFEIPNYEVRKAYLTWIGRHIASKFNVSRLSGSASTVMYTALSGSVARFRTTFRNCFEKEHLSTVMTRDSIDRILILGFLMTAQLSEVDFILLKGTVPEEMTLGFYDHRNRTSVIIVMVAKTLLSKASLQKASNNLLSQADFLALSSQLPQEASTHRYFSIVICGSSCSVSGRISSN